MTVKESANGPTYTDRDNAGTMQNTCDQAITYWSMRNMLQKFDPFVLHFLSNETAARKALLEIDCLHESTDRGTLICTEPLVFGITKLKTRNMKQLSQVRIFRTNCGK